MLTNTRRILYKILHPIARLYWFIVRPQTKGVKCIIERNGQLLMIRNSYSRSSQWNFPGGGVKRGESLESAAWRELKEETGLVAQELFLIGSVLFVGEYKKDTLFCFYGTSDYSNIMPYTENSEILEAKWFTVSNLPKSLTPSAKDILPLYFSYKNSVTSEERPTAPL